MIEPCPFADPLGVAPWSPGVNSRVTRTGLGLLHLRPDCPSVSGVVTIGVAAADLKPRGRAGGTRLAKSGLSDTSRRRVV